MRKVLLIIAGTCIVVCSGFGIFMMTHGVHGLEDAVLTALVYVFPALSVLLVLLYLRTPLPAIIGSWTILAGGFLSFLCVYRFSCHASDHCLNASLLYFARCTLDLAWHLRLMLAIALLLQITPAEDRLTRALRQLKS